MAERSDHNTDPPQQKSHSDSDEIRELLLTRGSDSSGNEETDAALASFVDPALFDGGVSSGALTQTQAVHHFQQQIHPQLYQQGHFYQHASVPYLSQAPELSQTFGGQQPGMMAWQQSSQMNDPFAALMSASAAAAVSDSNTAAASAANVEGIDPIATAAALAAGDCIKIGNETTTASAATNHDESACVRCSYPACDLRILCTRRCTYHARCIDLIAVANSQQQQSSANSNITVYSCPHCSSPSRGLEILPLSFEGMDKAQRMNKGRSFDSFAGSHARKDSDDSKKRSNSEIDEAKPNNSGISSMLSATPPVSSYSQSSSQCYDPTVPRTGRWTDEELALRDSLISHFLEGSLPLSNGLKLNDFLSNILKSKQSRLTKKMKHAKLSTKYFHIFSGCQSFSETETETAS